MSKELTGKICRYIVTAYFIYATLFILIKIFNDLNIVNKENNIVTVMNSAISISFDTTWVALYCVIAFSLIKNKRDTFWAILVYLVLWGAGGNIFINAFGLSTKNFTILVPLAYVILSTLLIASKYLEPEIKKDSLSRAREIFGEHLNKFSAQELSEMLKK